MPTDADRSGRTASRISRFGGFEVDLDAGQIRKRGSKLRLPGQSFEILRMLLERRGKVVSRKELIDRLWSKDIFLDVEHGLNAAINKLREVLSDSTERPRYIETLPRRGYRFIAPLKPSVDLPLPQQLAEQIRSVAVLPLKNLSGDPEQEYFADGMTGALINDLAKISALRVISQHSSMQYKGVNKSLPQIAQELNVDGVVEGSVFRVDKRVRISVQLVHAASDTHVLSESYERDVRDVMALQRWVARATDPLSLPININVAAVFYFRRDYDRAIEHARKTLEMDFGFSNAHLVLSFALQKKAMHAEALAEAKTAASLSRNNAASLGCIGGCYAAQGKTYEARKIIGELEELSKRHYVSPFVFGWVHLNLRDKEAALAHLERAYAERSAYLSLIKIELSLDFLRSDPRFQDLQRRVGLYP